MTILSVIQEVSLGIGIGVPTTVFGGSDRDQIELASLANEMAQRIAFDGHEWTLLKTLATMTGDGAVLSFALPTDYRKMLKQARVWPSESPNTPLTHIADTDEWLGIDLQSAVPLFGIWTLIGSSMHIKPAVPVDATRQFYYVSNLIVAPINGANKTAFTADSDTFRLNERVLKLGIQWQWKANKGRPYAEDLQTYETALGHAVGEDKGSNIITMSSRRPNSMNASTSYPWALG